MTTASPTSLVAEPEERAELRRTVSAIAGRFGHRYYADEARSGGHAIELWEALGGAGFLGVNLPERYGGGGGGIGDLAAVQEELGAVGCPLLMIVVSPAVCAPLVMRFGTPEQCARWLPGIASGEVVMSFAITEPDAGSNSHRIRTTAERTAGGWRLRGAKHYISGVDRAAGMIVVARTGPTRPEGRGELSLFVVETDRPGIVADRIETEVISPEHQFSVFFDDVDLPGTALLGEEGQGLRQVFSGLNPERILSAAVCTGLGRYLLDRAADYARERVVWSAPIGTHQAVAHPLARAKIALESARLLAGRAAALYDAGAAAGEAANMAKFAAAEAASDSLDCAVQTHGGHGLSREHGIADLWGLVRLYRIAPVSQEMILNYVAGHSLGLGRSY